MPRILEGWHPALTKPISDARSMSHCKNILKEKPERLFSGNMAAFNRTYYPEDMSNCKVFETCKVMHDVLNRFTSAAPLQKHIWALLYDVCVYYMLLEGLIHLALFAYDFFCPSS